MLVNLGFAPEEVYRATSTRSSILYVSAVTEYGATRVLIDTTSYLDLWVRRGFVDLHKVPVVNQEPADYCTLEQLQVLGRTRAPIEAPLQETGAPTAHYLGDLGCPFFQGSVLGIDPAGPKVALADRPGAHVVQRAPWARVPLLRGNVGDVAVSSAVQVASARPRTWICQFSTIHSRSSITKRSLEEAGDEGVPRRRWRRPSNERTVTLALPGGGSLDHMFQVTDFIERYHWHPDIPDIDLRLGVDFLCGFCSMFDFGTREVLLYPYARSA